MGGMRGRTADDDYRNEDYRSNRPIERTAPCYTLEEEYSGWNMYVQRDIDIQRFESLLARLGYILHQ